MKHQKNPGEGDSFDEYFSLDECNIIVESSYKETSFKIFMISRESTEGDLIDSHYTGYVRLSDIISEADSVNLDDIPRSPGHYGANFGPTTDGWVGFGTLDDRDYNYYEDRTQLNDDRRISNRMLMHGRPITHFTPAILTDSIQSWIDDIILWRNNKRKRINGK